MFLRCLGAAARLTAVILASVCAPPAPAHAIDLEAIAYKVIDMLPLKPEEKGFAKFTVKSPKCSEALVESIMGDKVMVGLTAVFKAYKPGVKPFDIHSAAECKMKMNPVNFAFSQAMGQSKGFISQMPAPYDASIQQQADQTLSQYQADANTEMMDAFPFTRHIECACEAAFHTFSPSIENTFAAIKTGNASVIGEAVYTVAIENSSLPIKPIRLIIKGDIKGAATSLVGQYGIPVGCKVGELLLGVPSQICETTAGYVGKGAKFVAGIASGIYDKLAGTAADPNHYYAEKWRPWLAIAAANRIGEDGGWIQKGQTAAKVLPAIWKPCVSYYADHGKLLDELTFSDDDAARDICDPMRDQFAGAQAGSDLNVVLATARQAARDFYQTGFKDALYKAATPYAGKPGAAPASSPNLFGACIKGVDPLVLTLPARSEGDRQALSEALCNELLLGPDATVAQDLKSIAASMTPIKSAVEIKKDAAKAAKETKKALEADREELQNAVMDAKGKCNPLAGAECADMRTVYWNACEALLTREPALGLAKAKTCVAGFIPAAIKSFNDLAQQLTPLSDKCAALLPDESNRKACMAKARTALYSCGKPSVAMAVAGLKALANDSPAVSGNTLFAGIYNASGDLISAQMWLGGHDCPATASYFANLEAKLAKQKALQDAAEKPQQTQGAQMQDQPGINGDGLKASETPLAGDGLQPLAMARAGRDLMRLGCEETEQGSSRFRCHEQAANNRCTAYMRRKLVARCELDSAGSPQGAEAGQSAEAPSEPAHNQNAVRLSPARDLIRLGCADRHGDGQTFSCQDDAALARCQAYLRRSQVSACEGGQNDGAAATPGGAARAVRDLTGLGCRDLRHDGSSFLCPDDRAFNRCVAYQGRGLVGDCVLQQ